MLAFGTGLPTTPQTTPSTSGWSSLRLGYKEGLAQSFPTLSLLGTVMDRLHSHGCTQGHVGNQLIEQPEASRVQTGNSFVFLQQLPSDLPYQTAFLYLLTRLMDPITLPSLPVLRTSLILVIKTYSQAWPSQTQNISPMQFNAQPPLPQPRPPPLPSSLVLTCRPWRMICISTALSCLLHLHPALSWVGVGKGGWYKVDLAAT